MAVRTSQVQVGTTAVQLSGSDSDNTPEASIAIKAPASTPLYIGGPSVSTSNGWIVAAGDTLSLDIRRNEKIYGVIGSGTQTVYVLELGV